jgi:hypothetical protein
VTVDRGTRRGGEVDLRVYEAGVEGLPELVGQGRKIRCRLGQGRKETPRERGPIRVSSMPERL